MAGNALILQPGRTSTPEQRLVAAIIAQAFRDMSAAMNVNSDRTAVANDARSAMLFLTSESGSFARWRNELCDYLGIDGNVLAERVRKMLEGDLPWADPRDERLTPCDTFERGSITLDKSACRARERWQHLKKRL